MVNPLAFAVKLNARPILHPLGKQDVPGKSIMVATAPPGNVLLLGKITELPVRFRVSFAPLPFVPTIKMLLTEIST
jgi:hypothetical protein